MKLLEPNGDKLNGGVIVEFYYGKLNGVSYNNTVIVKKYITCA